MCGRYTITVLLEELIAHYFLDEASSSYYGPRYNVAPGQLVPAIVSDGRRNRLGELKWGLVPPWADDPKIGYKMINARSETALERPAFRSALRTKRCLIPADGFYEWQRTADGGKRPMRITLRGGGLFSLAALYETWVGPDGAKLHTCAVLTTSPNALMADIHDRMPVILRPEDEARWLDRRIQDPGPLLPLLAPYPAGEMTAYEVDRRVGNVANDDPALLAPVGGGEQGTLF
ncbi:SOS response-associated peptidase [Cohnella sp. REN36]|uniref:SOS response-associated peptidase n=1 Tax=Cohnella sp. REN36 TaxID=2887347 RepID=UPI001D150FA1|nr:SOS response-associated peptidase [Cohnella sp. REN36]MCC3373021.1 SOS response-associated peptidase [Cohnella sp. REN36]